jgi:hypothetical protein
MPPKKSCARQLPYQLIVQPPNLTTCLLRAYNANFSYSLNSCLANKYNIALFFATDLT